MESLDIFKKGFRHRYYLDSAAPIIYDNLLMDLKGIQVFVTADLAGFPKLISLLDNCSIRKIITLSCYRLNSTKLE